jgi:hypothetical protein
MKIHNKKLLFVWLGLTLVSSVAWSDTLKSVCKVCVQIPKPLEMCARDETPVKVEFCGAENWERQGAPECKLFETMTVQCASGKKIRYTEERWFGAGSSCDPIGSSGNHGCY